MIRISGILLLIMLLSNCSHFYRIKPLIHSTLNLKEYPVKAWCVQRCYSLEDQKTVEPTMCGLDEPEMSWEVPLKECHGTAGFHYTDWLEEILPKMKAQKRKGKRLYSKYVDEIETALEKDDINDLDHVVIRERFMSE